MSYLASIYCEFSSPFYIFHAFSIATVAMEKIILLGRDISHSCAHELSFPEWYRLLHVWDYKKITFLPYANEQYRLI